MHEHSEFFFSFCLDCCWLEEDVDVATLVDGAEEEELDEGVVVGDGCWLEEEDVDGAAVVGRVEVEKVDEDVVVVDGCCLEEENVDGTKAEDHKFKEVMGTVLLEGVIDVCSCCLT